MSPSLRILVDRAPAHLKARAESAALNIEALNARAAHHEKRAATLPGRSQADALEAARVLRRVASDSRRWLLALK